MTGPGHYREAERLLDLAEGQARSGHDHSEAMALAAAQVHAVLALTAAYAADAIYRRDDRAAWDAATGHATTGQEITR